jgi:nucleotide-binding universal stress UspA family protein
MDNKKDGIIILWDFSEVSEFALQHAVQLNESVDSNLVLYNIVPGGGLFGNKAKQEENRKKLLSKFVDVQKRIKEKYKLDAEIRLGEGSFSKGFKEVVEETNANLLVMGKEFKAESGNLTFKEILKQMESFNLPIIQVTAPPTHARYSEIVVPLDHNKKYKEKLHWIIYLSKYYNFNVNIIKSHSSDDLLKKQMSNNVFFTKKMLDNKKIVYGIKTAKKGQSYSDEILRFAHDIEADLIVVMTPEYTSYIQKSNGVDKATVPIMCVNPRKDLQKFAGFR